MSDLQTLRDLGASLDADHVAPVADIRAHVMAAAGTAAASSVPAGPRSATRRRSVPHLRWRIALAGGLAAALAGGVVTLYPSNVDRGAPPDSVTGEPSPIEAQQLLRLAALAAATTRELTPRPDQFILIESTFSTMATSKPAGPGAPPPPAPSPATMEWGPARTMQTQEWRSADGTRDGLLRDGNGAAVRTPGCVNGKETFTDMPGGAPAPCQVLPGYLKDLPTDPDAMLAHLRRTDMAQQGVYSTAVGLLFQGYLAPPARAALFRALATLPGITVVEDLADAAGRHGVAVTRTSDGVRGALIFDPASHAFLGARTDVVAANNPLGLPFGATPWSHAITRYAVVDQVGQLPD